MLRCLYHWIITSMRHPLFHPFHQALIFVYFKQQRIQTQKESSVFYSVFKIPCWLYLHIHNLGNLLSKLTSLFRSHSENAKVYIHGNCVLFSVKMVIQKIMFCIHGECSSILFVQLFFFFFSGSVGR